MAALAVALGVLLPASSASATSAQAGTQALAQQLIASGRFSGTAETSAQVQAYANGVMRQHPSTGRDCYIDTAILQALKTVVVDRGFSIRVSSLNRYCTGELTASGTGSYHWRNGGGHAVDIDRVNGVGATGSTSQDRALIQSMTTALPGPAGLGQSNCRSTPVSVPTNWVQFSDSCNHNHFEYRGTGVTIPGSPATANDAPSSIIDGSDRISLYAIRSDGNLWGTSQASAGSSFSAWQTLGGSIGSLMGRPAVVQLASGVIAIYARTSAGYVVGTNQTAPGGSFTPWTSIGTSGAGIASDPVVVQFNNGAIGVYAMTDAGYVAGTAQGGPGGAFSSWVPIGSTTTALVGRPALVHLADDRLMLFATSADGFVHASEQPAAGGAFTAWSVIGTGGAQINSEPIAVNDQGRVTVYAAAGSTVSSVTQDAPGGSFHAWLNLGSGSASLGGATPFAIVGGGYHSIYTIAGDRLIWGTSVLSPPTTAAAWSQIGTGALLSTVPVGIRTSGGVNCVYAASNGSVVGTCQNGPGGTFGSWSTM